MLSISASYSCLMESLSVFVSDDVGVDEAWRGDDEKRFASVRADRPPGSDCMFSFWFSMISKSMRSSEADMMGGFWCLLL